MFKSSLVNYNTTPKVFLPPQCWYIFWALIILLFSINHQLLHRPMGGCEESQLGYKGIQYPIWHSNGINRDAPLNYCFIAVHSLHSPSISSGHTITVYYTLTHLQSFDVRLLPASLSAAKDVQPTATSTRTLINNAPRMSVSLPSAHSIIGERAQNVMTRCPWGCLSSGGGCCCFAWWSPRVSTNCWRTFYSLPPHFLITKSPVAFSQI